MIFERYISPDQFEFLNTHCLLAKNDEFDEAVHKMILAIKDQNNWRLDMEEKIGHGFKRIAEALAKQDSIWKLAVRNGAVNINDKDVKDFENGRQTIIQEIDNLHQELGGIK